jgi:hypothetical protein
MSQSTSINVYRLLWYAQSIRLKAYRNVLRHQTAAAQDIPSPLPSQDYRHYKYDTGTCCYHTLHFSLSCDLGVWVLGFRVPCPRHIGRDAH